MTSTEDALPSTHTPAEERQRFFSWPRERRGHYGWGRVAAAFVLLIGGATATATAAGIAQSGDGRTKTPALSVVSVTTPILLWGLVTLIVGRLLFSMRIGDFFSHRSGIRWGLLVKSLLVAGVGFGLMTVVNLAVQDKPIQTSGAVLAGVLVAVLLVPLQAASEELMFRGLTVQTLLGRIGVTPVTFWVVTAALTALFAALHGATDPAVLLALVAIALLMAYLTWRLAGLEAAIAVHVMNNVTLICSSVLRGTDLTKGQSASTTSMTGVLVQIAVAALVTAVICWIAAREKAHG